MILGFKNQFVPMVLDGSKRHTIRAGFRWKVGMRADLYTGAYRPGARRLLFRSMVTKVETIEIYCDLETRPFGYPSAAVAPLAAKTKIWISGINLSLDEAIGLAQRDGFRVAATQGDRATPLTLMLAYLARESGLSRRTTRFTGQLIHWDYDRREPNHDEWSFARKSRRAG